LLTPSDFVAATKSKSGLVAKLADVHVLVIDEVFTITALWLAAFLRILRSVAPADAQTHPAGSVQVIRTWSLVCLYEVPFVIMVGVREVFRNPTVFSEVWRVVQHEDANTPCAFLSLPPFWFINSQLRETHCERFPLTSPTPARTRLCSFPCNGAPSSARGVADADGWLAITVNEGLMWY